LYHQSCVTRTTITTPKNDDYYHNDQDTDIAPHWFGCGTLAEPSDL